MMRFFGVMALLGALIWGALWHLTPADLLQGIPFGGLVVDAHGELMRLSLAVDHKYRLWLPLEKMAPESIAATLSYEDKYFYSHPGFNPVALARGALSLLGGRRVGGSTITMQVARLRWGIKTARLWGKIQQIILAIALECRHSKQDILEAYFNLAPYGSNVEGIEAAARVYFHKGASALTPEECRALALIPQNPVTRHPVTGNGLDAARKRFFPEHYSPLRVFSARDLPFVAPHLALELARSGEKTVSLVESDLQRMIQRRLADYVQRHGREGIANGAVLLLRATDMAVVGAVGSSDFANAAIGGQIDGTRIRRSPGSTLKPFIYALALDQGLIHPGTILADAPRSFGGYDPENFDGGFQGPISATEALLRSRNLPAIALAEQLHHPGLYGLLQRAQVALPRNADYYGLALVLGGAEITMRELACLYAMLANGGLWRPLRLRPDASPAPGQPLITPESAWLIQRMLYRPEAVVSSGLRSVHYMYKTGTSNGFRDAWTAGLVGDYVLVVWLGNFDNRPHPSLVGAKAALPLFEEIAMALGMMRPLRERGPSPPPELNVAKTKICANTGDIFRGQCGNPVVEYIIPGVSPVGDTGIWRKIWVDKHTGMRVCSPENAEAKWVESWPTDMQQIFAAAGVYKTPMPPWSPGCGQNAIRGTPPRIMLPKRHVIYIRHASDPGLAIPLQGAADVDVKRLHWYADDRYLGSTAPGEIMLWDAQPGRWRLAMVDDQGRSAQQECRIDLEGR